MKYQDTLPAQLQDRQDDKQHLDTQHIFANWSSHHTYPTNAWTTAYSSLLDHYAVRRQHKQNVCNLLVNSHKILIKFEPTIR